MRMRIRYWFALVAGAILLATGCGTEPEEQTFYLSAEAREELDDPEDILRDYSPPIKDWEVVFIEAIKCQKGDDKYRVHNGSNLLELTMDSRVVDCQEDFKPGDIIAFSTYGNDLFIGSWNDQEVIYMDSVVDRVSDDF